MDVPRSRPASPPSTSMVLVRGRALLIASVKR